MGLPEFLLDLKCVVSVLAETHFAFPDLPARTARCRLKKDVKTVTVLAFGVGEDIDDAFCNV